MAAGRTAQTSAFALWTIFLWIFTTEAAEEVLMDTRTMSTLAGWTVNPSNSWIEVSNINPETGHPVRTYQVCQVQREDQNNWLRTEWIPKKEGQRIYVEIRFSIRECRDIPNVVSCKETFDFYYFESDADDATDEYPAWNESAYTKVDRIAADGRFSNVNVQEVNKEIRNIGPINKNGFYLAFQDSGACMSLLSVRVYYKVCPTVSHSLATFNKTVTGPEVTSLVQAAGSCVPNAEVSAQPTVQCTSDGKWTLFTGGCQCLPGHEPDTDGCTACHDGTFKPEAGNDACQSCPARSQASYAAATICACHNGFYRAETDQPGDPCTAPPSKPRNIVSTVNKTTVDLSWEAPLDDGGRDDLVFKVVCQQCSESGVCTQCDDSVQYVPSKDDIRATWVKIQGLMAHTRYKFEVHAENGVSEESGVTDRYESIALKTNVAAPSQVESVTQIGSTEMSLSISWSPPRKPNGVILEYRVQYYPLRDGPTQVKFAKVDGLVTQATVEHLDMGEEYVLQIQARTIAGYGQPSQPVTMRTDANGSQAPMTGDQPVMIAAIAAAGIFVLLVFVLVVIFVLYRRRNRKPPSDMDKLEYSNGEVRLPGFVAPRVKTYIDPHTYEDPQHAVLEFAKELEPSCLTIEQVIGGGEFGDVCKGRLKMGKGQYLDVAIKTLKAGSNDKMKGDFLTEASIMGQFTDPNVIKLQGVITKSRPVMIVTEYMENGSLDTFLRKHDGRFQVPQLVGMIRGVASGMRYLAEMNYVHRDLAARNVLVNSSLVCKVSDFGLSRVLEDDPDAAYTTRGGKIPVRWTAPEAIAYRKFTSASDVWSYGVLVWEVMSYGERPYWNWSNQDVIKSVEAGYRLPPPMDCPKAIYQLMSDCWQKERNARPKFTAIVASLDKLIRNPMVLRVLAQPRYLPEPMHHQSTSSDLYSSVPEWLDSLSLGRYTENFLKAGFTNLDCVAKITLRELQSIGVTMIGHQKKIMNSVQLLRAQASPSAASLRTPSPIPNGQPLPHIHSPGVGGSLHGTPNLHPHPHHNARHMTHALPV
ncbi:ephrin type-B receptor 3-like isoform X3 [Branchiostoma floridae x Branchiostoma belcheri]